jgi:hypothetical protein
MEIRDILLQIYSFLVPIWSMTFWFYYPAVIVCLILLVKISAKPALILIRNSLLVFLCLNSMIFIYMTLLSFFEGHVAAYELIVFSGPAFLLSLAAVTVYTVRNYRAKLRLKINASN